MLESEKMDFSNKLYDLIKDTFKVEHIRIELWIDKIAYNGDLLNIRILFNHKGNNLRVYHKIYVDDFKDNKEETKKYILKLMLDEIYYS